MSTRALSLCVAVDAAHASATVASAVVAAEIAAERVRARSEKRLRAAKRAEEVSS